MKYSTGGNSLNEFRKFKIKNRNGVLTYQSGIIIFIRL